MVSIITVTARPNFLKAALRNFESQRVKEKELILVLHGIVAEVEEDPRVTVLRLPAQDSLGTCLNKAIRLAKFDIIAKFDDDDFYSPCYLSEAIQFLKENKADVVGKQAYFIYFKEDQLLCLAGKGQDSRRADTLAGATLVFKRQVARKVKFPPYSVGEDAAFLELCKKQGIAVYATSPYNYAYIRYSNSHHHSDADNRRLRRHCVPILKTPAFEEYVNFDGGIREDG